jgi:hypothetical protein
MARTVLFSNGLEDLFQERRPIDLADVAGALWADPLASAECDDFCDGLHVYPLGPCACGGLRRIRARHRPAVMATRIQSLWRGYKTRKTIEERNAEEIEAMLPIWRFYDEDYNRSVLCQTLMVELKRDDPTWDATQTPHYQWMLIIGGPFLEECETYMLRRGWVRPQKQNLHVGLTLTALYQVIADCGFSDRDPKALSALVRTFEILGSL